MTKSKWKFNYQAPAILKRKHLHYMKIWSRNSVIDKRFVGTKVFVHNGKSFLPVVVNKAMIGHKFGEFAFTKRLGSSIHKKKRKKKNKTKK